MTWVLKNPTDRSLTWPGTVRCTNANEEKSADCWVIYFPQVARRWIHFVPRIKRLLEWPRVAPIQVEPADGGAEYEFDFRAAPISWPIALIVYLYLCALPFPTRPHWRWQVQHVDQAAGDNRWNALHGTFHFRPIVASQFDDMSPLLTTGNSSRCNTNNLIHFGSHSKNSANKTRSLFIWK